jgi:hypothetical protein
MRKNRQNKHPDGGKSMIQKLKELGFWKRLTPARFRITDTGHTVGNKPREEE